MTEMICSHCGVQLNHHEATRCLDAWVAEKVMDEVPVKKDGIWWMQDKKITVAFGRLPHYSTRIADAWKILDKFFRFQVGTDGMIYLCEIEPAPKKKFLAGADEAPFAICRAALKAIADD